MFGGIQAPGPFQTSGTIRPTTQHHITEDCVCSSTAVRTLHPTLTHVLAVWYGTMSKIQYDVKFWKSP